MKPLRKFLSLSMTAFAARLGSVGWVHGDNSAAALLGLVNEHISKRANTGIVGGSCKVFTSIHEGKRKIFDSDQGVFICQVVREFVKKIASLVGDVLMQLGDLLVGFFLPLATFDLPGGLALKHSQAREVLLKQVMMLDDLALACGDERLKANINTYRAARVWMFGRWVWQFKLDHGIPFARMAINDDHFGGGAFRNWPMIGHINFADIHNIKARSASVVAERNAIAIGKFKAGEHLPVFESGETRLSTLLLHATEEGLKGFVQAAQNFIHRVGAQLTQRLRVVVAQVSKIRPLVHLIQCCAFLFVNRNTLSEGFVPDLATLPEQEIQGGILLFSRVQAVFVGAVHSLLPRKHSIDQCGKRGAQGRAIQIDYANPATHHCAVANGRIFPETAEEIGGMSAGGSLLFSRALPIVYDIVGQKGSGQNYTICANVGDQNANLHRRAQLGRPQDDIQADTEAIGSPGFHLADGVEFRYGEGIGISRINHGGSLLGLIRRVMIEYHQPVVVDCSRRWVRAACVPSTHLRLALLGELGLRFLLPDLLHGSYLVVRFGCILQVVLNRAQDFGIHRAAILFGRLYKSFVKRFFLDANCDFYHAASIAALRRHVNPQFSGASIHV